MLICVACPRSNYDLVWVHEEDVSPYQPASLPTPWKDCQCACWHDKKIPPRIEGHRRWQDQQDPCARLRTISSRYALLRLRYSSEINAYRVYQFPSACHTRPTSPRSILRLRALSRRAWLSSSWLTDVKRNFSMVGGETNHVVKVNIIMHWRRIYVGLCVIPTNIFLSFWEWMREGTTERDDGQTLSQNPAPHKDITIMCVCVL